MTAAGSAAPVRRRKYGGAPLWVRQIGTAALSPPLLLTHLEAMP